MTDVALNSRKGQATHLLLGLLAAVVLAVMAWRISPEMAWLTMIGLGFGLALYHGSFGFTGAYRNLIRNRDMSGVTAQLVMLALATVLFAPMLSGNSQISGAVAPVSVALAFGAFLFGIGMQLGSGCASGTLFAAGGGNLRAVIVLICFCAGAFWASLDLQWWFKSPSLPEISLQKELGYGIALPLQLALLLGVFALLRYVFKARLEQPMLFQNKPAPVDFLKGPWPLLLPAVMLAMLNWATLVEAGHAWSITWGYTLWGAKAATLFGWEPTSNWFWTGGYQESSISASLLDDNVSTMNMAIIIGAWIAASLQGRIGFSFNISGRSLLAAIIGGLAMGYGARLAYGCNIGAFFSGVASTSLHGWTWIVFAIPGNIIGVKLRPLFDLD